MKMIISLSLITLWFGCRIDSVHLEKPFARNGILDLRTWQFGAEKSVDLVGEWNIYWNRLVTPDDFSSSAPPAADGLIEMQKAWSEQSVYGKSLTETGCATFRLLILLPPVEVPLSVKTGRIMTAFRMWANGHLIAQAGVPDTSAVTTKAMVRPQIASFTGRNDSLDIVLQIANYGNDRGGVTGLDKLGTIIIGPTDTVYGRQLQRIRYEALLIGVFIVMAMFQFALFLSGKKEKSLIFLGIICLLMIVYTVRDNLLMQYFPGLPWEIYSRIINIPVFMLAGFFLLFFHSLYPEETNKRLVTILTCGWTLFAIAVILLPQRFSFRIYLVFISYMFILIVYMISIVVRAAFHQRNSAKYIIFISWIVAFTVINDVLKGFGIINTEYLVPFAVFMFILMCEFAIYERFIRLEQFAKKQQNLLVETEKLASLGTLVAGVAHEINNPNNSILLSAQGHLEIWGNIISIINEYDIESGGVQIGGMQWEQLRDEMPESINRIIRNSRRIERIVTDLKTYARKDIGNVMEPLDINAVIKGCITLLENKLKNSTDAFSAEYGEGMPMVKGNFQKLEQAIINLIVNACQALPDRNRAVRIGTVFDTKLQRVSITVSDEGSGIEPHILQHIFDPFFTTKHDSGGTGLGLSIVQSIVAGHNGELTLHSEIGIGTRVTINLPVMEGYSSGITN